jgi:hypothetical protein
MARKSIQFKLLGIEEVTDYFIELGKVPQASVKKSARAGAVIVKRKVPQNSQTPEEFGLLKKSIITVEEGKGKRDKIKASTGKSVRNVSGKAGFQVTFDNRFNDFFQKEVKDKSMKGSRGSKKPKDIYYYPASMEYGFMHKKKGSKGKAFIKTGGHFFMLKTAEQEYDNVQNKMLEVLSKDIDKIQTKKGKAKTV